VQHLGDVRPFTHTNSKFQKLSKQSKNQLNQPKIDQTGGSKPEDAVLFTEDKKDSKALKMLLLFFEVFLKKEKI
jgi:hypothetical protein